MMVISLDHYVVQCNIGKVFFEGEAKQTKEGDVFFVCDFWSILTDMF